MSKRAPRGKPGSEFSKGSEAAPAGRRAHRPERAGSDREVSDPGDEVEILGERLRRLALGLTAALLTARAYYPSEPDIRSGAGSGLTWILLILLAAGLAIVAAIVDGRFRIRMSWTDLAVLALVCLVALSSSHAIDRRPAINLAWEWIGIGIAYLLVRNLPRGRGESVALAGALAATAVAVSAYGLYQGEVEFPALKAAFLRNPGPMLEQAGVTPGTPGEAMFRSRLLGSNDLFATFGHPNSLGGFLVGPLVMMLGVVLANLARPVAVASRVSAILKGTIPVVVVLGCLIMSKSRSAYIGLGVGALVLLWQARARLSRRNLVAVAAIGVVAVLIIGLAAWQKGYLDRLVLTESEKSMRVRLEYWQATWGVITDGAKGLGGILGAPTLWLGVGPGNFGPAYLLHKLPQASDEIQDPHNMVLEVWAVAGIWAMLALLATLGLGLWSTLGSKKGEEDPAPAPEGERAGISDPSAVRWVLAGSGAGWALVVAMGELNPFVGDLFARWLILGASWLAAILLGRSLWVGSPPSGWVLGAGALAIMVNLLAAGGIGIPTVALCLWTLLALGQNLRDDRPCGALRTAGARTTGLTAMGIWVAVVGLFVGAVVPYWNSEAAIASADAAIEQPVNPNFQGAEAALLKAVKADQYSARPWRKLAGLYLKVWQDRGAKPGDIDWQKVPVMLLKAVSYPRNPNVWSLHAERADVMGTILKRVGESLKPIEKIKYLGNIVEASRTASRLYPSNATLHARLALASAEISMFPDAVSEANEALRLDTLTPHLEKKLPDDLRKQLQDQLPTWKKRAEAMPVAIPH